MRNIPSHLLSRLSKKNKKNKKKEENRIDPLAACKVEVALPPQPEKYPEDDVTTKKKKKKKKRERDYNCTLFGRKQPFNTQFRE